MPWIKGFLLLCFLLRVDSKKSENVNIRIIRDGNRSETLQREILNLMGLRKRPEPSREIRKHGRKLSAPRFMIDLYNSLSKNDSELHGFCCNGSLTDQRAAGADTIMSFPNHSK